LREIFGRISSDYYVIEYSISLSDNRENLWIMQPLSGVKNVDLKLEIHDNGFCLNFRP